MAVRGGGSCEAKVFVFGRKNIVQFVLGVQYRALIVTFVLID
jgi:hypothetical protein